MPLRMDCDSTTNTAPRRFTGGGIIVVYISFDFLRRDLRRTDQLFLPCFLILLLHLHSLEKNHFALMRHANTFFASPRSPQPQSDLLSQPSCRLLEGQTLMRTLPYSKENRHSKSLPHADVKQRSREDQDGNESCSSSSVPRVFQIITPQHFSCDKGEEGGFAQCLLVRDVTSGPRERYRLSFQLPSSDSVVPAMVAQKENSIGGHYNLFDLSRAGPEAALTKKAGHFIGKLRQDPAGGPKRLGIFPSKFQAAPSSTSTTSTVSYTLFNGNEGKDKLGVFIYDAPGLVTQWREGQPPRKLRAILADSCNKSGDVIVLPNDWTEQRAPATTTCRTSAGSSSTSAGGCASGASILELKTKEPFFDAGQYRLNFRGRVTVPSVKNFQLADDDGNVLLQFGRVSDHKFHLDFRRPFCAATAFAAALTQFDI